MAPRRGRGASSEKYHHPAGPRWLRVAVVDDMTAPDELERAVDRLEKAMKIADQYAAGVWFGEGNDGFVSFATILAILSERAELLATVERMRGALMAAQSFIADGGLAETDPGASIYRQVTAALTTGEEK